jgi:dolichol-phosphate mannosyltransferase
LKLSIVVPVYNEEEVIDIFLERIVSVQKQIQNTEIILVDDGSTDNSWLRIYKHCESARNVKAIKLSRNFGHQNAVLAGLSASTGDFVCIIDADLQDPPELIPDMLRAFKPETEIVYGLRTSRLGESKFKLFTARAFYWLFSHLVDFDVPENTGDFRIATRKAVDAVLAMNDCQPYLRGMFAYTGFISEAFPYSRDKRYAGHTKYTFSKMLGLSGAALLSFSSKPLRIFTKVSLAFTATAAIMSFWSLLRAFFSDAYPGWSSVFVTVWFFGSANLLMLALVGNHVLQQLEISKNRPKYIISDQI